MADTMTRADDSFDAGPIHGLPTMQRRIVELVEQYTSATQEPCPGRYLARRLSLHHSTIQIHLAALHRKGWIRTPGAPVFLARRG